MTSVIAHRGPDADGFYVDGPAGLGHRRLAIIDLSDRGRQPMATADGRFVIVFNGEIYNYLELRKRLEAEGFVFRTDTDTEVLLTLYAKEGAAALHHLNGMFAFAVWDSVKRELFIARDRIGIKPLYYAETPDGIVFASEAKALFEHGGVTAEPDTSLIGTFMAFGYVPGDRTLFRHVHKLRPGHSLLANDRSVKVQEYWDVRYAPDTRRTQAETAALLHDLLLDSARIHLRSDVPVGVFLSGGLDSSTVVSLLSEAGIRRIKTFAVAYRHGSAFDESAHAARISKRFETDHHVLYVEPEQFLDFIPGYVWHMDEPVTEAAALSLYFISRELRQHVTVALSGEGADELFAGYQIYRYMLWLESYRRLPAMMRTAADSVLSRLPHATMAKYARLARLPLEQRYLGVSLQDPRQRAGLYSRAMLEQLGREEQAVAWCYERTAGHDPLTRMLYSDLKTWLVDDLLVKADKMTMANSVELRVPFLDYRVVEFAATIPSRMKLHNGDVKWILKQTMADRLPPKTVRRSKVGFPTPLALMFRGQMSDYLHDVLLCDRAVHRGYFDRDTVARLLREHLEGTRDHHQALWQLVVLEEWHRAFADRRPSAPAAAQVAPSLTESLTAPAIH